MLREILHRKLNAEEKKLGGSMDYLRHILDVSRPAFLRFASIMPFANSRKSLPAEAWFVAQIVSLKAEDCGPCLQITVNLARQQKVATELVQATVDGRIDDLPNDLAKVFRFTQSVVNGQDNDELREELRQRYGEQGLIEIAYAVASSRIPPTVKRVLGFAKSCQQVSVSCPE